MKIEELGDFIVNLSVDISSKAIAKYCLKNEILYTDTSTEYWAGGYTSKGKTTSQRSNYWLRDSFLELKGQGKSTCLMTDGDNPGLISHLTKQGIMNIAKDILGSEVNKPKTQKELSTLSKNLNIKIIHVAERDIQESKHTKKLGEFVNTWSVDRFISELGWGTHEKNLPKEGHHHDFGNQSTWVARFESQIAFLITHAEAISISDYFTLRENEKVVYRLTVHYAYHPCIDAVLSCIELRIYDITDTISGEDTLGVLIMGHKKNAYWYGSKLDTEQVKKLIPYNTATSLQVTITVVAGMILAIRNPSEGVIEPDEVDFEEILEICNPYLGDLVGVYTDWNPLKNRKHLFKEKHDDFDAWLFENFLLQ
eukprot:gene7014-11179_t